MDKQDAYETGKDRGQGIGSLLAYDIDDFDTFLTECYESEQNARQYSDFSFIAHAINKEDYPDELWGRFDEGLLDGYNEAWARCGKQIPY